MSVMKHFCASSAAALASGLDHSFLTTPEDAEGACYTSLISNICYSPQEESTYFTGILQKDNGHITTSESPEELGTPGPSLPEAPGMESRGLFSSDSGIEMTPAESTDVNMILADPLGQMKAEACKYIDITRPEEVKCQGQRLPDLEDKDLDFKSKDTEISIKPGGVREPDTPAPVEGKVIKDHLFEESTFAPHTDDFSEEQHTPLVTAPIRITLTETEPAVTTYIQDKTPEKQDVCLKPSPDMVPTVTVSEPEDDSPESVTPPSSSTGGAQSPLVLFMVVQTEALLLLNDVKMRAVELAVFSELWQSSRVSPDFDRPHDPGTVGTERTEKVVSRQPRMVIGTSGGGIREITLDGGSEERTQAGLWEANV
ncbi:Reticulon-1 [Fukomys damarensis]|uniref:Reticulon-1 n=1 Tax=Fukomys damarensis TaxID=885580 RepID=A0A091CXA0_FUKDA|nr:Reticulon-1 [Fukomys damarensis]